MEPTPNSGQRTDWILTTFTLGVLFLHCYNSPLIVATPKGHRRDTDQAVIFIVTCGCTERTFALSLEHATVK
jgi:hypothetical protein